MTGVPRPPGRPDALPSAAPAGGPAPLTAAEAGIWFGQRLDPTSPAFNTAELVEIRGPVDLDRLVAAIASTMAEVETLHRWIGDDRGRPRTGPAGWTWPIEVIDARGQGRPRAWADALFDEHLSRPIDLAQEPPGATLLVELADGHLLWFQQIHHIAVDGHAAMMLLRTAADAYRGPDGEPLAGASTHPGRFATTRSLAEADRQYRDSPSLEVDRSHWTRLLDDVAVVGLTPSTGIGDRRPRRARTVLPPALRAQLEQTASAAGLSWIEVVLATLACYLHRMTGATTAVIGLPVANRDRTSARAPAMVMNLVPLRVEVNPDDSVLAVARRVRRELRGGEHHRRYRHEDLRRDLGRFGPGRRLFSFTANVLPYPRHVDLGAPSTVVHNVATGPVEDLTFDLRVVDGEWVAMVETNPDLYSTRETGDHLARVVHLLGQVDPHRAVDDLELTTPDEIRTLDSWSSTHRQIDPDLTVTRLLAEQCSATPEAVAITASDRSLTYRELDTWSDTVAASLTASGVGPGRIVGIALPRSMELVVAVVATLKAGAAYLPLEVDHPPTRLATMVDDAQPAVVVVEEGEGIEGGDRYRPNERALTMADLLAAGSSTPAATPAPTTAPVTETAPAPATVVGPSAGDPAYVIYTSGSTGRPKGVVISHRAIVNRLLWMGEHFDVGPHDRIAHKTPFGFDVSVWELLLPLVTGATMVVAEPGGHRDPSYLTRLIETERVTMIHFVPSMLRAFVAATGATDAQRSARSLRHVICSGEALGADLVAELDARFPASVELHNLYGPTEAAVDVTAATIDRHDLPGSAVPIGRPVWNTWTEVLDQRGRPLPVGLVGELHLGGVQLAEGYLGRPDLTAERFVDDPRRPGRRLYRTGDLASWRDDGQLLYHGREDDQVKLRGQRIELGEIEVAMGGHPHVRAAAVTLREDRPGDQRLVGYVVVDPAVADPDALVAQVRDDLAGALPAAMVPTVVVVIESLPLSGSGKLARDRLPAPPVATGPPITSRRPRTPRQQVVCEAFAAVLGVEHVGLDDGFFELGGHSLLAIELAVRLSEQLGVEIGVSTLFHAPTPALLLGELDGEGGSDALGTVLALRGRGSRPPVWCIHPAGGLSWCYANLVAHLDAQVPVLGLQADGLDGSPLPATIDDIAARYATRITTQQPDGPYQLLGWSVGGTIAHAIAVHLQESGAEVSLLALLDCYPSEQWADVPAPTVGEAANALLYIAGIDPDPGDQGMTITEVARHLERVRSPLADLPAKVLERMTEVVVNHSRLMKAHRHRTFRGDLVFFCATAPRDETWLDRHGWQPHVTGRITSHDLACTHPQMVQPRWLAVVAQALQTRLR